MFYTVSGRNGAVRKAAHLQPLSEVTDSFSLFKILRFLFLFLFFLNITKQAILLLALTTNLAPVHVGQLSFLLSHDK